MAEHMSRQHPLRDIDFTEVEAILRVHEHPPFGAYVDVVMERVLDAEFLTGWNTAPTREVT